MEGGNAGFGVDAGGRFLATAFAARHDLRSGCRGLFGAVSRLATVRDRVRLRCALALAPGCGRACEFLAAVAAHFRALRRRGRPTATARSRFRGRGARARDPGTGAGSDRSCESGEGRGRQRDRRSQLTAQGQDCECGSYVAGKPSEHGAPREGTVAERISERRGPVKRLRHELAPWQGLATRRIVTLFTYLRSRPAPDLPGTRRGGKRLRSRADLPATRRDHQSSHSGCA